MTKFPLLNELVLFAVERDNVRLKKEAGLPKPWTRDRMLQQYSFTNVHREDDKQTKLIKAGWRDSHAKDEDLWFAMLVARLVNWWPSLEALDYPVPWKPERFKRVLRQRQEDGHKLFSGAYIINQMIKGGAGLPKHDYLAEFVLGPAWKAREMLRPRKGDSLYHFCCRLVTIKGLGGFIAGQVIADVKYARGSPLFSAPDWETWAASGPGSRRGLNLVCGRERDESWKEEAWLSVLQELRTQFNQEVGEDLQVHAQDMQNVLCEFSKYTRGSSRSKYKGTQ